MKKRSRSKDKLGRRVESRLHHKDCRPCHRSRNRSGSEVFQFEYRQPTSRRRLKLCSGHAILQLGDLLPELHRNIRAPGRLSGAAVLESVDRIDVKNRAYVESWLGTLPSIRTVTQ